MMRYIRSRREILYAKIACSRITVADQRGHTLAVMAHRMDDDPYFTLKAAGFYMVHGGWPQLVADGRPFRILVRRRLVGAAH